MNSKANTRKANKIDFSIFQSWYEVRIINIIFITTLNNARRALIYIEEKSIETKQWCSIFSNILQYHWLKHEWFFHQLHWVRKWERWVIEGETKLIEN